MYKEKKKFFNLAIKTKVQSSKRQTYNKAYTGRPKKKRNPHKLYMYALRIYRVANIDDQDKSVNF